MILPFDSFVLTPALHYIQWFGFLLCYHSRRVLACAWHGVGQLCVGRDLNRPSGLKIRKSLVVGVHARLMLPNAKLLALGYLDQLVEQNLVFVVQRPILLILLEQVCLGFALLRVLQHVRLLFLRVCLRVWLFCRDCLQVCAVMLIVAERRRVRARSRRNKRNLTLTS